MVNASSSLKCIFLISQPYITRPTLIDLNSDEHNKGFCYRPFMVNLDVTKIVTLMNYSMEYVSQTKQKM